MDFRETIVSQRSESRWCMCGMLVREMQAS